ncbi:MAG: hypothetical protein LDL33_01550 [Desulfomonile sp.]|nr:hypothetical protein [Desulfomonile sp.]
MEAVRINAIADQVERAHRDLAKITVALLKGTPSALGTNDVLEAYPLLVSLQTIESLRAASASAQTHEEAERAERLMFACMDLAIEAETAHLGDMISFFTQRAWMHVGAEKISALDVVPWIQSQDDFAKREEMRKENSIFLKAIVNKPLAEILDTTIRIVTDRFGFRGFADYCEAKKQVSFDEAAARFERYLSDTAETYVSAIAPWVEEKIGRPFRDLSRYHALYLVRISTFDEYFSQTRLADVVFGTFRMLGFDAATRSDVTVDMTAEYRRRPDGICVGVEIPGDVHVIMKPVGGLIDYETLLHEMGHAFFLSHFAAELPLEFRRLYRNGALDETFAFLFMNLVENSAWLTQMVGLPEDATRELKRLFRIKKLCLIRRYMGKFLAEKELHESGDITDHRPYCRQLGKATGFVYEPQGYLIDMEPNFYSLDYLMAWEGAEALRTCLEERFGEGWFASLQAGDFLRRIAAAGRRDKLDGVLMTHCGEPSRFPDFSRG